jgi:3'-5' exonuclease
VIPAVTFDIETIPEPGWQPSKADDFPRPIEWRIVSAAVGVLRAERFTVSALCTLDERSLLDLIVDTVSKAPTLVTWNGRGFDLPVVVGACMRHRRPFRHYYQARGMRYRYTTDHHVDLLEELGEYGAVRKAGPQDLWARECGLPRKTESEGGDAVQRLVEAGELHRVAEYNAGDARQLAANYVRWLLVRGRIDDAQETRLQEAIRAAVPNITAQKKEQGPDERAEERPEAANDRAGGSAGEAVRDRGEADPRGGDAGGAQGEAGEDPRALHG